MNLFNRLTLSFVTLLAGAGLSIMPVTIVQAKKVTSTKSESKPPSAATLALMSKLSNLQSFEANFIQTSPPKTPQTNKIFSKKDTAIKGLMQVKRPASFRWQVSSPMSQLIVANGNSVWVYDADLAQASQHPLSKQLTDTPALLFSSNPADVAKAYLIVKPIDTQDYFVLYPRDKDSPFQHLSIGFQGNLPIRMAFTDISGQQTKIKFENGKVNPEIANKQFEFVPPVGVDVYTHQ